MSYHSYDVQTNQKVFQENRSNASLTPYERCNQYYPAKLKASRHKWHFNKLEEAHTINHMKYATNTTLHILKVSRHIDLCGIQKK